MSKPDLTPFWCLAAYDTQNRLTYATGDGAPFDPHCYYPSVHGGLSHRPRDARKFASAEEAAAALPALLPWIEKYLEDDAKRARESRGRDKYEPLKLAAPLAPYFEDQLLCVYPDGSGLARDYVRDQMGYLQRNEEHCRVARAFVQKHLDRLAGMCWRIWLAHEFPEFQVGGNRMNAYRGEYCDAKTIAALWPVKWRRRKEEHPPTGYLVYDWIADLDGVRLIIEQAESHRLSPPDDGLDGTTVRIESEVSA